MTYDTTFESIKEHNRRSTADESTEPVGFALCPPAPWLRAVRIDTKSLNRSDAFHRAFGRDPDALDVIAIVPPSFESAKIGDVSITARKWSADLPLASAPILDAILEALPTEALGERCSNPEASARRADAFSREAREVGAVMSARGIEPHPLAAFCMHRRIMKALAHSAVQAHALPSEQVGDALSMFAGGSEAIEQATSGSSFLAADAAGSVLDAAEEKRARAKEKADAEVEAARKAAEVARTAIPVKVSDLKALVFTHNQTEVMRVHRAYFPWVLPAGTLLEMGSMFRVTYRVCGDDEEVMLAPNERARRWPTIPEFFALRDAKRALARRLALDSSPITEFVDGRHPDYQKRLQTFAPFVDSHRLLSGDIEPFLRIVLANVGVRSLRLAPDLVAREMIAAYPNAGRSFADVMLELARIANGTHDVLCSPDEPFAGPITKHRRAS